MMAVERTDERSWDAPRKLAGGFLVIRSSA